MSCHPIYSLVCHVSLITYMYLLLRFLIQYFIKNIIFCEKLVINIALQAKPQSSGSDFRTNPVRNRLINITGIPYLFTKQKADGTKTIKPNPTV